MEERQIRMAERILEKEQKAPPMDSRALERDRQGLGLGERALEIIFNSF